MPIEDQLAELKATFPNAKVLYAPEIAIALNRSPAAIRRLLDKRQIPDLKPNGGKLGVSVVNFARYLEEGDSPQEAPTEIPPSTKGRHKPKPAGSSTRVAPRLKDLMLLLVAKLRFGASCKPLWNRFNYADRTSCFQEGKRACKAYSSATMKRSEVGKVALRR